MFCRRYTKKRTFLSRQYCIYREKEFYIFNNSYQKSLQIGIRRLLTGAGDENRTHNRSLGSSYFATKLRPLMQLTLYILLYFLPFDKHFNAFFENLYSFAWFESHVKNGYTFTLLYKSCRRHYGRRHKNVIYAKRILWYMKQIYVGTRIFR